MCISDILVQFKSCNFLYKTSQIFKNQFAVLYIWIYIAKILLKYRIREFLPHGVCIGRVGGGFFLDSIESPSFPMSNDYEGAMLFMIWMIEQIISILKSNFKGVLKNKEIYPKKQNFILQFQYNDDIYVYWVDII